VSNDGETLKSGLGVIQGRGKWQQQQQKTNEK